MLRSCYQSEWSLFTDPTIRTPGRYVFAPPNTPAYPFPHNFLSRNWTEPDERSPRTTLGELDDVDHVWSNGLRPVNYPAALAFADGCLENGEQLESVSPYTTSAVDGAISAEGLTLDVTLNQAISPIEITQSATAQRTYTLTRPRSGSFSFSGILDFQDPSSEIDIRLAIDDRTVATSIVTSPYPPSRGVMADGRFELPAGEHTVAISVIRRGHGSLSELTAGVLLQFEPEFTYEPSSYREGFQLRCYLPQVPFPPIAQYLPDLQLRKDQVSMAQVLNLLYISLHDAEIAARELLGTVTLTSVPNSGSTLPGSIIAQNDLGTVVWFSGTSTYQQFALQAASALTGPFDVGIYGTSLFWQYAASALALRLLAAGVDPAKPMVFCGHSYGAVAAAILAARMVYAGNPRIDLLTFGRPTPGDARLKELLKRTRSLNYANIGDVITCLPPQFLPLAYSTIIVPPPLFRLWGRWARPENQVLLAANGTTQETQDDSSDFVDLMSAVTLLLLGSPVPALPAHPMQAYLNRLLL